MSMLVVGLMLVAALNTIGASKFSQSRNAEQALGPSLAQDLMSEILSQKFEEAPFTFGRDSGESGGERTDWDDVDDYDGWSASPPEEKDGTELPDLQGWGREVVVCYVKVTDPNDLSHIPNGLKRVDVKVTHQGRVVTTLSALRSTGWPGEDEEDEAAVVTNQEPWVNLGTETDEDSTTISTLHEVTAASGTDRLLLVAMATRFGANQSMTVTTATFGGVALNPIVTGSNSSTRTGVWMGYLLDNDIPTGRQALSVKFTTPETDTKGIKLLAATYSEVDQSNPVNSSAANTYRENVPIPFGSQIDYLAGGEVVYVASSGDSSNTNTTEPAGYSNIYTNEYSGKLLTTISHKDDTRADGNSPGTTAVDFLGTNKHLSLAVVALNPTPADTGSSSSTSGLGSFLENLFSR